MDEREQKVWDVLKAHVGRFNSATPSCLMLKTGLNERVVRDALRSLRLNRGKLVCYSQDKPGGYFIAESIEELETCRNLEASREQSVRENRQFYDHALTAAKSQQADLFGGK